MTEENNGGKTSYYDLPKPNSQKVRVILEEYRDGLIDISLAVTTIYELFPQTLNDIIEAKDMKPWQHEIMKATYALNERALKNPKKGSSKLREINKILYYAERGKKLILEEEKVVENSTKPHFKIKVQSPIKKVEND